MHVSMQNNSCALGKQRSALLRCSRSRGRDTWKQAQPTPPIARLQRGWLALLSASHLWCGSDLLDKALELLLVLQLVEPLKLLVSDEASELLDLLLLTIQHLLLLLDGLVLLLDDLRMLRKLLRMLQRDLAASLAC